MAPMDDYENEYYEDDDRSPGRGSSRRTREDRFEDDAYGRGYEGRDYDERSSSHRGGYRDEDRFEPRPRGPREYDRSVPRLGALRGSTRGALAMDPRRMAELFGAGDPPAQHPPPRAKDTRG